MLTTNTSELVKAHVASIGLPRVAEMIGVNLSKTNKRMAHCPNKAGHKNGDRNASLSFIPNGEGFKCFGCGARGDVFNLYMLRHGCDFKTAVSELAGLFGIDAVSSKPSRRRKQSPQKPPAYKPRMNEQDVSISTEVLRLNDALWSLVKKASNTLEMSTWLDSRCLNRDIVRELGWRSLFNNREKVFDILNSFSIEVLEEAGYLKEDKWWSPLRSLKQDTKDRFCLIPVFWPGYDAPITYRHRSYEGGKYKSLCTYGSQTPPMGLSLPKENAILHGASRHRIVIVVEGEPDWATLSQEFGPQAGIVCLTNVSSGWPEIITPHLDAAELVLVMTHDAHGRTVYNGLYASYKAQHGIKRADKVLKAAFVSEGNDLNDRAKRGELDANLSKISELIESVITS